VSICWGPPSLHHGGHRGSDYPPALTAPNDGAAVLDQNRTGLPRDLAALIAIAVLTSLAVQLLRWFRARLDRRQATILGVLIGVAFVGGWTGLVARLAADDRLLVVPPTIAWSLVVVGAAAQALLSWLERTRRL
jgi:hypothetical protein